MTLSTVSPLGRSTMGPMGLTTTQFLAQCSKFFDVGRAMLRSALDGLIAYIRSTADSDQSGDYNGMGVGEKRSFQDFITSELDDSEQPRISIDKLKEEIRKYRGMLRRTKAFQRQ